MNPTKATAIYEGQSAAARKVYLCVPSDEPLAASKIHTRVLREGNQGMHVTKACLGALSEAGLIRQVSKDRYQRKEEVPGTATLESLSTENPSSTPKLGDLMRLATNAAKPIPQNSEPQRLPVKSAMAHLMAKDNVAAEQAQHTVITQDPEQVAFTLAVPDSHADPLAQLADLAGELLDATAQYGNKVKAITAQLEDIALAIESERQENQKAAVQLKKFRAMLSEAGE